MFRKPSPLPFASTVMVASLALPLAGLPLFAQAGGQPPAGAPRRAFSGPNIPKATDEGFRPIFDGTSLTGWEGNPAFWKVEDGAIVGQTTAENPTKANTFLIWRAGKVANFELKLEYKISGHNSGIQYRSQLLPGLDGFAMSGYQSDIDAANTYTGLLYEERARGFLAPRGQANMVTTPAAGQKAQPVNLGSYGTSDELKALLKVDDWNEVHIIARGNLLMHIYNGRVFSSFIDEDVAGRSYEGLLGLQLHTGPPMRIAFRNLRIRQF